MKFSDNLILCTGDTAATCKVWDIPLEYNAMFDGQYAAAIGELNGRTTSIPYTKVTTTNDMPHYLFAARLQNRDIYPKLNNSFTKSKCIMGNIFHYRIWAMGRALKH